MEKLLVSACLLGIRCRYDGKSVADDCLIGALSEHAELIPFCPEVYGGLPTPRPPAEIIEGRVIADTGRDVTGEYERGAREALAVCKRTKETIPHFHINNVPVKMISKYFDGMNHENTADIDAIITKYENLLEQIMTGQA